MLDFAFRLNWDYNGQRGKETVFHTAISTITGGLRDWAPAYREIIDTVLAPGVQEQFETAGHGDWAELAPSTIQKKGHDTILFDSGRLYRSFQEGSPDNIRVIERTSMQWGSRVPYALFHQTGTGTGFQRKTKSAGKGMPMRKEIVLSSLQKRMMRSILVRRLTTIARAAGFGVLSSQTDVTPGLARHAGMHELGL